MSHSVALPASLGRRMERVGGFSRMPSQGFTPEQLSAASKMVEGLARNVSSPPTGFKLPQRIRSASVAGTLLRNRPRAATAESAVPRRHSTTGGSSLIDLDGDGDVAEEGGWRPHSPSFESVASRLDPEEAVVFKNAVGVVGGPPELAI